jgi:dUTP pyrophosphatase
VELLKNLNIKKINKDAIIPKKATEYSSGFDLFASEDYLLEKKKYALIPTGISIELEKEMEAQVRPRSGLAAKHGVTVLNSPGTIDADYRGEIKVALINHSDNDFKIEKGMRIAQLVITSIVNVNFTLSDELSETVRGSGGFGSTGLKNLKGFLK